MTSSPRDSDKKLSLSSSPVKISESTQLSTTIGFGTPVQNLTMLLNMALSYTWVPSTTCNCHQSNSRFDSSKSSSYQNLSTSVSLEFFQVNGTLSSEEVTVGDLDADNQTFILASFDKDLDGLKSDGMLGLGFKEASDGHLTFIENLKDQEEISRAVFSFYLDGSNSVFTVGEYDFKVYGTGEYKSIQATNSAGFWTTSVEEFRVESTSFVNDINTVFFNIGNEKLVVPKDVLDGYFEKVSRKVNACINLGFMVSCVCEPGEYDDFPDLEIKISGNYFKIQAKNFIHAYSKNCDLLLESGYDKLVLGKPFFEEYYTVFDMDNMQVLVSGSAKESGNSNGIFYYALIAGAAVLVVIIVIIVWLLIRKKKPSDYHSLR
jgi:hypothetical protein